MKQSKIVMSARVHYLALVNAREYAKDGYKLTNYDCRDAQGETWYLLDHPNGNRIEILSNEFENYVRIWKNRKLNKEIRP